MVTINDLDTLNIAIADHDVCLINIGDGQMSACIIQKENIETIEKHHEDVYFIDVNIFDAPEIAAEYAIMPEYGVIYIPVSVITKYGGVDSKVFGLQTIEQLEERLRTE